jgi:glutaconate CoA-transferase subunit A
MKLKAPFTEQDKRMKMKDAIANYIHDGDVVYVGGFQIGIPTEPCFEMVRQEKKGLTAWTVGHDTCLTIDLLVGTGCCKEVHYGWFASWPARRAPRTYNRYRDGSVKLYLYSNLSAMNALIGSSMGMPYMPITSDIGSDLERYNPNIKAATCPFTGKPMGVVKAPEIDVAIIHVQRADKLGNGQRWMSRTVGDEWAANGAKRVILTCEEIVSTDVIKHDPDRTMIPFLKTCSVTEIPWGAHPTGMFGYYIRDNPFETYAAGCAKDDEKYHKFVDEWVLGLNDRSEYIKHYVEKFGHEALERLKIKNHIYPIAPIDYGYTDYEVTKGVEYK